MLQDSISGTFTDLWSLGIIIYQIFEGRTPWTGNGELAMFENIINKDIKFSNDIYPVVKDLICKLLIKDPLKRFGYGPNGDKLLRSHDFFAGIDFNNL